MGVFSSVNIFLKKVAMPVNHWSLCHKPPAFSHDAYNGGLKLQRFSRSWGNQLLGKLA
jgi:hypothetical protein